jgi:hypothetical protein
LEYKGYLITLIALNPKRIEVDKPEDKNYSVLLKIEKI